MNEFNTYFFVKGVTLVNVPGCSGCLKMKIDPNKFIPKFIL